MDQASLHINAATSSINNLTTASQTLTEPSVAPALDTGTIGLISVCGVAFLVCIALIIFYRAKRRTEEQTLIKARRSQGWDYNEWMTKHGYNTPIFE